MPEHLWPADPFTVSYRLIECPDCTSRPGCDPGSLNQPEPCPTCAGYGQILHPDEVEKIRRRAMGKSRYADLKRAPEYIEGTGGRFAS